MKKRKRNFPTIKDKPGTWALYYLQTLKWAVIPLIPGTKKSLVKWKEYQTKLPTGEDITRWWADNPDAEIGVVMGQVSSGLIVLDIDSDKGEEDIKERGGYPLTATCETKRGKHLYFKTKKPFRSYKGDGWDVQAEGGIVKAPPGTNYSWQVAPYYVTPRDLPAWLDDILTNKKSPKGDQRIDTGLEGLLKPYWVKGNRHNLALGLSGYLFTLGWLEPMTRHLIEKVCDLTDDEERLDRARDVTDTYKQARKDPTQVIGYQILEENLTARDYKEFERLARKHQIPEKIATIDRIRLDTKTALFLRNRNIGQRIRNDLKQQGCFLRINERFYYWFDQEKKQVLPLSSPKLKSKIDKAFGVNPSDPLMKFVLEDLKTETIEYGKDVELYNFAFYEKTQGILYIYAGTGATYRLDGKEIKRIDNGQDDIYFREIPEDEAWKADFDKPSDPFDALVKDLSFDTNKDVALRPELQKTLFWYWLRTLFFESIQPAKPLFTLTGDTGSGKTTALARMLKLFCGKRADVYQIPDEKDWDSMVVTRYFFPLDNIDKRIKWLPNKLDVMATGGRAGKRKLFTDLDTIEEPIKCFAVITTLSPPWQEAPLARRMVLLRMKPFRVEKVITKEELYQSILSKRNQLWAGLLTRLNKDIELINKKERIGIEFGMPGFAELVGKLSTEKGKKGIEECREIFKGLGEEQVSHLLQDSIIPVLLDRWSPIKGQGYTAAELFSIWKEKLEEKGLVMPFRQVRGLGMHLANIKGALKKRYGIMTGTEHGTTVYYFPTAKEGLSPEEERVSEEKVKNHKKQVEKLFERQERLNE